MAAGKDVSLEMLDVRDEWALPIGRFMVAFSGCEAFTYMFIRVLGSIQLSEACRTMDLKQRLAVVRALIDQFELSTGLSKRVTKSLDEMGELMTKRNLIAHNCPTADVYFHKVTGEVHVERTVRSQRDKSKVVTLPELGQLLKRALSLEVQLADLLYQLQLPENRMVRAEG